MGYKTKKLIMNRDDIKRKAQTEPDSSMIEQFRKLHLATNISVMLHVSFSVRKSHSSRPDRIVMRAKHFAVCLLI